MRGSRANFENGTTGSVADFNINGSVYPKIKLDLATSSVGRNSREAVRRTSSRDQELGYTPERRGGTGLDNGSKKYLIVNKEASLEPNSR